VAQALRDSGSFHIVEQVIDKPTAAELGAMIAAAGAEAVFPVLHGHWGEGGPLQELLEECGVPFVGSRPKAAALAMDKLATKTILAADHVPTPPSRQLLPDDVCDLDLPLVIKPVDDGSSVDLRICRSQAQVESARRELHPKRGRLMAERYIQGREITAGIIHGRALPLIEIIPGQAVEFYDYQAKYHRDDTQYEIDPELPGDTARRCKQIALLAFNRLGCRDVARVDFMVDENGPWFLEINTMPGFTTHSLVPMAARKLGLEMPALCASLAEGSLARAGRAASLQAR
jgi:D-alanine-D-alanine ligase